MWWTGVKSGILIILWLKHWLNSTKPINPWIRSTPFPASPDSPAPRFCRSPPESTNTELSHRLASPLTGGSCRAKKIWKRKTNTSSICGPLFLKTATKRLPLHSLKPQKKHSPFTIWHFLTPFTSCTFFKRPPLFQTSTLALFVVQRRCTLVAS